MSVRSNKSLMAVGVTYDRHELIFGIRKSSEPTYRAMQQAHGWSESPGTPRRRSSAFQGSGSRQSSFVDRPRGNSRQWDSPRGSLAGITSSGYGQSPAGYSPASSGYGQASPNYGQNSSGHGQTSSGYGQSSPAFSTPRGSLTGASG